MYCDETNTPFTAGREKHIKWRNKDGEKLLQKTLTSAILLNYVQTSLLSVISKWRSVVTTSNKLSPAVLQMISKSMRTRNWD